MILVDSNVPMYLVGADHPHKFDSRSVLERLLSERQRLVTDAEAFQEILHRYCAINRRDAVQAAYDALRAIVDEVFPVEEPDVIEAKNVVATHPALSARDALHVAVMRRRGVQQIFSFDRGFETVTGIERIPPGR